MRVNDLYDEGNGGAFIRAGASLLLSLLVILLILVLAYSIKSVGIMSEEEVLVRTVELAALPPPPPPPPPEKTPIEQSEAITSSSISLVPNAMAVDYAKQPPKLAVVEAKVALLDFNVDNIDWKKTLRSSFPEVDMNNLDEVPRRISRISLPIPRELRKRGITRVETSTKILIDERGKVYVRKIINAGYPEMEPVIRKFMKGVKFTPPTKDGKPVHATYTWQVNFGEKPKREKSR